MSVLQFVYSRPYENSLAVLTNQAVSPEQHSEAAKLAESVQEIWGEYEDKIIAFFEEVYLMKVDEQKINAYISLIMLNNFSDPLTFSLIRHRDGVKGKLLIFNIIHELAHYFVFTRPDDSYLNKLLVRVKEKNLLSSNNASAHYLIQSVEFGIGAEVLGVESAINKRNFTIENSAPDYADSARLLKEQDVPLDKSCLKFIEEKILI
jgi:hypothetical protein